MHHVGQSAESVPHRNKRPKLVDEYAEIDKQVNSHYLVVHHIGDASDLSDTHLSLLLIAIREYSHGQIPLKNSDEIFKEHRDLKDKLRAAWKAKSYREILQRDYFQPFSDTGIVGTEETPQYLAITKQVLQDSWTMAFRGDSHTVLYKKISAMYDLEPNKNICAIVQSSGTGKSRMVDELAKLVYTLPINVRTTDGIIATYPPPDDVLRDYLVNPPDDEAGCRTRYKTFFKYDDLPRQWYERMNQVGYRHNFYESVVNLCKSPPDNQSTLKDLMTKLRTCSTNQRIQMVIYIDEAHELKKSCGGRTKLETMCSVIGNFCDEPLFFLLLSTQSLLHFHVPTTVREVAASERARGTTAGLLAPITETPFDCFLEDPIKPGVLHVEELSTLKNIAKWGRPLWWAMVAEGAELISKARMKLMCRHDIHRPHYELEIEAIIAVLDVLLAFDFQPNREINDDTQAKLVRSHMRMAYSVPEHHLYFRSGYPSEPLLAEAAAQQLLSFKSNSGRCFDVIADMVEWTGLLQSNLIDLGQRGEVFMRMTLMGAYMDGILAELGKVEPSEGIIFSKGCKLTTFIEQLFKPEYAQMVLDARPDNLKSDTPFSQAFVHSMVRFTHFVKAGDPDEMTSEALFGAFVRGMAFIGHQTHQAVDIAIPVSLNKEDTLQESAMSAILIQVKRRVKSHGPGAYAFTEDEVGLFPPQAEGGKLLDKGKGKATELPDDRRPYVTLVAEVGIEPEKPNVHVSPQPELMHYPDVHPRYAIASYGCTGVYKNVTKQRRAFFLARYDCSAEHPAYKVPGSRDLMMRLKPIWQRGENSYHWLDSDLRKKRE